MDRLVVHLFFVSEVSALVLQYQNIHGNHLGVREFKRAIYHYPRTAPEKKHNFRETEGRTRL